MVSTAGDDVPTVLHRFPDPLIRYETSDGEPVVQWANLQAEKLLDTANGEQPPLGEVLSPFDIEVDTDGIVELRGHMVVSSKIDGTNHTFLIRRVPTEKKASTQSGLLVFTDITEYAECADTESESPTREDVTSVLLHDLRNPLEVAQIRLKAARETGEDIHFEKINLALTRIERLIRDVRTVAQRAEVDSTVPVGLDAVTEDAWSTVKTGPATLQIEETATIEADEHRLRQLLENAFRNSVEHAGPDVTVRIGLLANDTGFYIADTGPGIPEDRRRVVFEPGVSSQTNGTGLGLTIIDQIAEAHGWDVRIAEADGEGTRIEVDGVTILD